MSNMKLAIRLRPFSDRETRSTKDCTPVVNIQDDHTVTITNIKVSTSGAGDSRERIRRYQADYTYNSACDVSCPHYASQDKIFDTMGRDVLSCINRGRSACVMAYGQSATGKTHTMMGTDVQPGLVPRLCDALAMEDNCEVTVSFLEIYNERVHDLLVGEETIADYGSLPRRHGNARKDLRVREHPTKGPYVQNLRRVVVHDAEALQALVSEGARRRRTAATRRNASSSRSHALLELSTPRATLHLADLAGSEKASWEGCDGGRQKEGANINKSLVALSNVISALVSSGAGRARFVPYRDSALTWLLKDCFTGGAAGFVIATVSPSVACYGESASTLRWASRARLLRSPTQIKTPSSQATRASLQAQLQQIIAELNKHHIRYIPETGKLLYDDTHWVLKENNKRDDNEIRVQNDCDLKTKTHKMDKKRNLESTASSIARGSSDHIHNPSNDKTINSSINEEVDKLFGPALERTQSGTDLKIIAPLRHKRRQYRSQEALALDNKTPYHQQYETKLSLPTVRCETEKSSEKLNEKGRGIHVPIMYDNNQRADIIASVTERLYSKLKKKEESTMAKVENAVDKKIMEPLSELKICSNARQRLVELSQRALRHRRKIGIPAHTQTKFCVTRVKDQGIDVQTDLEPYFMKGNNDITTYKNVSTETIPITTRSKEISVGPQWGSIQRQDRSTITEKKPVLQKNCSVMTEKCIHFDHYTQTNVIPPPRRKKKQKSNDTSYQKFSDNCASGHISPIININITQSYATEDESASISDDSLEEIAMKTNTVTTTPDLLTSHSSVDVKESVECIDKKFVVSEIQANVETEQYTNNNIPVETDVRSTDQNQFNTPTKNTYQKMEEIFSDGEDCKLPRVAFDSTVLCDHKNIKDMILGRNESLYPYNLVISPPRQKPENMKRSVTFKELDVSTSLISVGSQTDIDYIILNNTNSDNTKRSEDESFKSDSTTNVSTLSSNMSKCTNNFIWKTIDLEHKNNSAPQSFYLSRKDEYKPVYKNNSLRYNDAKVKIYKEFLGLNRDKYFPTQCSLSSSSDERVKHLNRCHRETIYESDEENPLHDFKQKCDFFESKGTSIFNQTKDPFCDFERKLLMSCDRLDASINKYDDYLKSCQQRMQHHLSPQRCYSTASVSSKDSINRKPTEYLQHLVQLRKDFIRGDVSSSDLSSGSIF